MIMETETYKNFCLYLEEKTGVNLDGTKEYLFKSRLGPLAQELGYADPLSFVKDVFENGKKEHEQKIIELMMTCETFFFRDEKPFEVLKTIIKEWLYKERETSLKLWSAACSSGQEPYTLSMILNDVSYIYPGLDYSIHATDLSTANIKAAQEGLYTKLQISRGLSEEKVRRYFTPEGKGFRVKNELQGPLTFCSHNLVSDPPLYKNFDIILLRNVLIYFTLETRKEVLKKVLSCLRPNGILLLGAAERLSTLDFPFMSKKLQNGVEYYEKQACS